MSETMGAKKFSELSPEEQLALSHQMCMRTRHSHVQGTTCSKCSWEKVKRTASKEILAKTA